MEKQLNFLIENGKPWVRSQRTLHRPLAQALSASIRQPLEPYFKPDTLDCVRVRVVPSIENPGFYAEFEKAGQPIPLDFSLMDGITFVDTVLIAEPSIRSTGLLPLIFHECVHVVQYKVLGADVFVSQYVNGWASNGFDYFSIPLEKTAYAMQSRFQAGEHIPFSVEQHVERSWDATT